MLDDLRGQLDRNATMRLVRADTKKKAAKDLVAAEGSSAQTEALLKSALSDIKVAGQMLQIVGLLGDLPSGPAKA